MKFIKIWIPILSVVIVILIIFMSRPQNIQDRREMKEGNIFADNITNYYHQHGRLPFETEKEVLEKLNPSRPYKFWWPLYEVRPDQTFTLTFIEGKSSYDLRYHSADGSWEKVYPTEEVELRATPLHLKKSSEVFLLTVTNRTGKPVKYGNSYIMEHEEAGDWKPIFVPSRAPLPSLLTTLGAGETQTDTLFIHSGQVEYPAGHYRISKLIHSGKQEICATTDLYLP